ncbi:MAG: electron transfer flavoprotein subunit beta/FixA family protein [Bacteroidales bacterium]|nr:electron transfer flavoprotein subunit beta/FixA family protein [Candidatus Scybalousia scybalohippi]MCQ2327398.1 electron transfer flavoprotein subunit beta/FixA family protein [Bacteroidales bacterium]
MSLKIVVLAKQVPDTRNVGKDAMTPEGTVNRQALPAIFNPEDLNALEMALEIKDRVPGSTITVVTMGPGRAAEIIRDSMFRGADNGVVLSDRKLGGSDTLATSYAISQAVKKVGKVDIVFGGRQAIDGDTAQVGPQTAEKLEIPQITYAEELIDVTEKDITIKRRLERGVEVVKAQFPLLVTAHASAKACRFYNAKRVMKYKKAFSKSEAEANGFDTNLWNQFPYLKIEEWNAADVACEDDRIGLAGSPTKVKKIDNVVLSQKENVTLEPTDENIDSLVKQLIDTHIIG